MAAIAPIGTYRKSSFKIWIFVCLGLAVWFVYDGYFSQKFIEEHTLADGKPDSTLAFNRTAPMVLLPLAVVIALRWRMVKDHKIVADGKTLVMNDGEKIEYASIEKIDKKDFEKKGSFVLTYKNGSGKLVERKFSDKHWDNLSGVLTELVAAVKGDVAS